MRRFALVFALVPAALPANAAAPLFDGFLKYCAATQADPGAVRAAVESNGGRKTFPRGAAADPKIPATVWKLGSSLWVRIGTDGRFPMDRCFCTVSGPGDKASPAAAAGWAGVARDGASGSFASTYTFRDLGGGHVPAEIGQEGASSLVLLRGHKGTFITLGRECPKPP